MSNVVTIGLVAEGPTDIRFLKPLIKRTFEEIAFECKGSIEVYDPQDFLVKKNKFVDEILEAAQTAEKSGIMVLCVHTDADDKTDEKVFKNKIDPAFLKVEQSSIPLCKNLVAIVPIQMIEAWMLADREKFKEEMGTDKSDEGLRINKKPESIADPKKMIEEVISRVFEDKPRRSRITRSELYSPLGAKADLKELSKLSSYQKFKQAVREAFKKLNYLDE